MFCLLSGIPIVLSLFVDSPGAPSVGQLLLQTWRMFWPVFFASALVLPLLLADVLRVSNRFAGPMYRLRNALRDLADGKAVTPVKFREGDFWCNMADEFNRVLERMKDLEPAKRTDEQDAGEQSSASQNTESLAI
jgi:hypothetical protein